jgi:hypothetical protein
MIFPDICIAASCVDHTAHLAAEDTLNQYRDVKKSHDRAHKFVNSMKDSNLIKEAFYKTMIDAGDDPLAIIQGTANRWVRVYFSEN